MNKDLIDQIRKAGHSFQPRATVSADGTVTISSFDLVSEPKETSAQDVFELCVSIHPNMNHLIISQFNNAEQIQSLLKIGSLYGEFDPMYTSEKIHEMFTIHQHVSVIQILSIREDMESLKVSVKFLDSPFAYRLKQIYLRTPTNFYLKARAVANYNRTSLYLITFDLGSHFDPWNGIREKLDTEQKDTYDVYVRNPEGES